MRRPITLLVALSIAIFLWWTVKKPATKPAPEPTPSPTPQSSSALPKPRPELYTAPREIIKTSAKVTPSEACLKLWNELRGLDLSQPDRKLPSATGCDKFPPELSRWHEEYLRLCASPDSDQCLSALYSYRAGLTEMMTKDTPLRDIKDPKVLTDKMLNRVLKQGDAAGLAEVAERLLELEPEMYHAARAAAMARLQDAQTAAANPDDPRWKKLEETLERTRRTNDDPQPYLETMLFAENVRYSDATRLRERAAEVGRTHPNLGVGPYHEAWAEQRAGNTERTVELLQEAIRREPQDPRYRTTLEAIRRGDPNAFQVNLSYQITP